MREYMRVYHKKNRKKEQAYMKKYYQSKRDDILRAQHERFRNNILKNREYGRSLCEARRARNLTQLQLSQIIGVSKASISNWERGRAPIPWEDVLPVFPELLKIAEKERGGE